MILLLHRPVCALMCVCACVWVCMCVHVHVCVHKHVCVCVCVCVLEGVFILPQPRAQSPDLTSRQASQLFSSSVVWVFLLESINLF